MINTLAPEIKAALLNSNVFDEPVDGSFKPEMADYTARMRDGSEFKFGAYPGARFTSYPENMRRLTCFDVHGNPLSGMAMVYFIRQPELLERITRNSDGIQVWPVEAEDELVWDEALKATRREREDIARRKPLPRYNAAKGVWE